MKEKINLRQSKLQSISEGLIDFIEDFQDLSKSEKEHVVQIVDNSDRYGLDSFYNVLEEYKSEHKADIKNINKVKRLRKCLYGVLIFNTIEIMYGLPSLPTTLGYIVLLLVIASSAVCYSTYYKITGKKRMSAVIGILSLFVLINMFVTWNIISKANDYIEHNAKI